MTPIGSYGWAYGSPVPKASDLNFKKYTDVFDDVKVGWATNTVKVNLPPIETESNYFTSELAATKIGANTTRFNAVQFHFHSPSEHTVDGKYHDLEMHTVHLAEQYNETSNVKYAAVGLFFSVEDYDRSITEAENSTLQRFFENL
jgi:carbonic anhydrase